MALNIGIGLALNGEKEFKSGIREVNTELKLLKAQQKEIDARYGESSQSLEALIEKNANYAKQLEEAGKKVELNDKQLKVWKDTQEAAGKRVEELKDQLARAENEMKQMESAAGTSTEEMEKQRKVVDELADQLRNAERTYETTESRVGKYTVSLTEARTEEARINTALSKNKQALEEAEAAVEDTTEDIEDFAKEVGDAAGKTTIFGDVLKANLISELVVEGTEKIAEGVKKISIATVSYGTSFESSMSQVAATMGMTVEEIEGGSEAYELLSDSAIECGKATKFSSSEAAEALNYLALAGYDAEKAAATLPKVLNLAAAGGLDLAYASDLVTDSMAALGMETSQLDNYIDQMAKTSQKSNTNVAQLGEATLVCAGTVSLTGQELATMNAELGVLANNGYKGAEGGTHLRNVLLSLTSPTKKAGEQLDLLGVSVTDSAGNVRDMNDILTDLNNSLSKFSSSEKTQAIAKIFNRTDIAAVNALLKGTGEEFDNLKAQLLDCEGAAQDMATTMAANLKGKLDELSSGLEALGIAAYEKIEGTLKKSVDKATESVGNLQESMDSGELGESMDGFAESFDEAATSAIEFAEDALPAVIDGLSWVLDNSDLVISGIAGITAANLQMKVVGPAVETVTTAWNAYKLKAGEAATVQGFLNTMMNANPAGIMITAIVGLTAAVGAYALMSDSASEEMREMVEENQRQIESLNADIEARKQSTDANAAEIQTIKSLTTQLSELNSKEKLSKEEKSRMLVVVEELNQAMPELNLTIDEQTGKLSENTEGWEANADAQLLALEMQFRQEEAEEIARERYEAEKQLVEIQEQRAELEKQLSEVTEGYNQCLESNKDALGDATAAYAAQNAIDNYKLKISDITQALEDQSMQEKELQTTISDLEAEYMDLSTVMEEVSVKTAETTLQQEYFKGKVYEVTPEVAAAMAQLDQAYEEAYEEAYESIMGQVGLFQELKTESSLTAQQMADNLAGQKEAYTNYSENLKTAAKIMEEDTTGSFSAIVQSIMDMGMDGAGYLEELVTAFEKGDESFQEVISNWEEMSGARTTLVDTMADMRVGYTEQMENLLSDQKVSTQSMKDDFDQKGTDIAKVVSDTGEVLVVDARKTMDSLESTITKDGKKVVDATKKTSNDTVSGAESALAISGGESGEFRAIGEAITAGMASGIKAGTDSVVAASEELAKAAYRASKTALEIKSPSRKARWLGEMYAEGFSGGVTDSLQEMYGEVQKEMKRFTTLDEAENLDIDGVSYGRSTSEEKVSLNAIVDYLSFIAQNMPDGVYIDGKKAGKLTASGVDSEFASISKGKERRT